MSKDINISYEDLVFGAFTALLFTSDESDSLTYDQLKEYETAIAEYCLKNRINVLISSDDAEKEKFLSEHDEFTFDNQKIFLANLGKWMKKRNAALDSDDGMLFLNDSVIKPLIKEKTLSLR